MEKDLALPLCKKYIGDLAVSEEPNSHPSSITIKKLNKLLVKVIFNHDSEEYSFRAMLSDQKEGVLMNLQEKVVDDFIMTGLSGFLPLKPNVHGGFIHRLSGLYFHVKLDYFKGETREFYFFGKPADHQIMTEGSKRYLAIV